MIDPPYFNKEALAELHAELAAQRHDITRLYASLNSEAEARIKAEAERDVYKQLFELAEAIPNMTDAQLAELRANALIAQRKIADKAPPVAREADGA